MEHENNDWQPDHLWAVRQSPTSRHREWEAYCRCGWVGRAYNQILRAWGDGRRHIEESRENDD